MRKLYFLFLTMLTYYCGLGQTIFTENIGTPGGTTAIAAYTGWQNQGSLTYSSGSAANPADVRNTSASTGYTGASGAGNVFFTGTAGDRGFSIESINASNYTSLNLQFAYRKESASALPTLTVDYWNGTTWVNVPFTFNEAANAAVAWYLSPVIALPVAAQINGLKLRWVKSGTNSTRVDDIILSGTLAGGATITVSPASLTGFTSSSGIPSAEQTYTVSGSGLTANISITAPAGFEISTTSGSGFTSNISLTQSSGSVTNTTIYVRMNSSTLGANSGNITHSSTGATTQNVAVSGNVLAVEPTVQASNIVVSNITNTTFDINWTNGNGVGRLVVVRLTSTTEVAPSDATAYTANAAYGTGGTTTGAGNFVVFDGTNGPVTVTGLTAGTSYTIRVYEYNGATGSFNYLTTSATNNPNSASTTGLSPNLQQVNFTGVAVPLYMASGNTTRLPVMFYAKVSNLAPNTTYRYISQAAQSVDFGGANSGAGNPLLIDYTVNPVTYTYTSSPSITTAGGYGKFTTGADGSFSGFFGFVNTGNARFTAGNVIFPTLSLSQDIPTPTGIAFRFALNQSMTVLQFGTTTGVNDGTFIKGTSSAAPGNIVGLWRSVDGSSRVSATARPLAMTIAEGMTVGGTGWLASFVTGYDNTAGSWNAIIPNNLPTGVQLIEQLNIISGSTSGCNSDADGVWPSGANTVNPTGGTNPITITSTDAPLSGGSCFSILAVKFSTMKALQKGNNIEVLWNSASEENVVSYFVERSSDARNFTQLSQVNPRHNNGGTTNYNFIDISPLGGDNYYRIKAVEKSAKIAYSNIVRIATGKKGTELVVYPNPVKGSALNVQFVNLPAGNYVVKLYAINGQQISSHNLSHAGGSLSETISLKNLKQGIYSLQIAGAVTLQKTFLAE